MRSDGPCSSGEPAMDSLIVTKEDPATDTEGLSSLESSSTLEAEGPVTELNRISNVKETLSDRTSQPVTPESPKETSEGGLATAVNIIDC